MRGADCLHARVHDRRADGILRRLDDERNCHCGRRRELRPILRPAGNQRGRTPALYDFPARGPRRRELPAYRDERRVCTHYCRWRDRLQLLYCTQRGCQCRDREPSSARGRRRDACSGDRAGGGAEHFPAASTPYRRPERQFGYPRLCELLLLTCRCFCPCDGHNLRIIPP